MMVGFFLLLLCGIPLYLVLHPPRKIKASRNHLFQTKYLIDLQKFDVQNLGYQETGENR